MIELLIGCIIVGLFAWGLTEVAHHGSIFEAQRAYLEVRDGLLGELASCAYCKSFWAALIGSAIVATATYDSPGISFIAEMIIMTFAGMRLANLFNDLTYGVTRLHNPNFELEDENDEHGQSDSNADAGGVRQADPDSEC